MGNPWWDTGPSRSKDYGQPQYDTSGDPYIAPVDMNSTSNPPSYGQLFNPNQGFGGGGVQFDQGGYQNPTGNAAGDALTYAARGIPTDVFGQNAQLGQNGYMPGRGPSSGSQQTGGLGGGGWTDPGRVEAFRGYGPPPLTGYTLPGTNYAPGTAPGPAAGSQQTWGLGGGQGVYSNMSGGGRGG